MSIPTAAVPALNGPAIGQTQRAIRADLIRAGSGRGRRRRADRGRAAPARGDPRGDRRDLGTALWRPSGR
jgi:hypothetical protein